MELENAAVIVTGGARGLGRAIAEAFAARGARMALVDILADQVAQAARELAKAGAEVFPVACDITRPAEVEAMAAKVQDRLGPADVLINNAGSLSALGPVWEVDAARWARDVTVNLIGTFLVTRAVVGGMIAKGGGYVIALVGAGVDAPHLYTTAYDASKAGVVRLMEALAREAGERGIKTFSLFPGTVRTPMTDFLAASPEGRRWRPTFKDWLSGHGVPPELAANWCLQLVSGRADAYSGRWFDGTKDFDETMAKGPEILGGDRQVLRLR